MRERPRGPSGSRQRRSPKSPPTGIWQKWNTVLPSARFIYQEAGWFTCWVRRSFADALCGEDYIDLPWSSRRALLRTHPELSYNFTSRSLKEWRENALVRFILVGFNAHRKKKKKITFSQFWLKLLAFKNANSVRRSLIGWHNNCNSAHTYRQRESFYFQILTRSKKKIEGQIVMFKSSTKNI